MTRFDEIMASYKARTGIDLLAKATAEAVATVFSDIDGLSYGELRNSLDCGVIPEGVSAWEPFEDYDAGHLAELVDSFADSFCAFAMEILGDA